MENLLPKGMLGAERRTILIGIVALVLAIILLLVYLNHYRSTVKSENASVPVLRAKVFVPAGTTALTLARRGLFEVTAIPKDQLRDGAITDAAAINGQVALSDIYPGQQLTASEFGTTATSGGLSASPDLLGPGRTAGTWRAISISIDDTHGLAPQTQTNDHIDVYVQSGGTLGLLMQNVLVLAAPNQAASGTTAPASTNYILRVPSTQAARFAYAQDNDKLWFVLRPQSGAKRTTSAPVSGITFAH